MEKVCIFCGQNPLDKNKEHILPRWLLKLTGTENSVLNIGADWKTHSTIKFSISAFTFPSCSACNSKFAKIEDLVKPVIEKILNDDFVNPIELSILLDWFDKVRISLWFGVYYLNSQTLGLQPNYFVNTRLALKDRVLGIFNCYDNKQTLSWTGPNSPCFIHSPTCFSMKINNIIFTNCSSDFIISEQLGFPYPSVIRPDPNSTLTDFLMQSGRNKKSSKLFQTRLYAGGTLISQPIFSLGKKLMPLLYDEKYIKENSYDYAKGIGKIFISHDDMIYPLEKDEEVSFTEPNSKTEKQYKFNRPTLELQIEALTKIPFNLELLNTEQKKIHHQNIANLIEYTKRQIKQYDY